MTSIALAFTAVVNAQSTYRMDAAQLLQQGDIELRLGNSERALQHYGPDWERGDILVSFGSRDPVTIEARFRYVGSTAFGPLAFGPLG